MAVLPSSPARSYWLIAQARSDSPLKGFFQHYVEERLARFGAEPTPLHSHFFESMFILLRLPFEPDPIPDIMNGGLTSRWGETNGSPCECSAAFQVAWNHYDAVIEQSHSNHVLFIRYEEPPHYSYGTFRRFIWAIESWFQQSNVSYIANNEAIGLVYRYLPNAWRVELL